MSELQTAITNLQLKHSELVAAVKSYPGTVAGAANAAIGEALVEQRKARDTIRGLRKRIENDGQSLILDWEHDVAVVNGEGKPINEVVEFSRSTGGGRFNSRGQYEWVPANVPRIDYDPMTGECKGLLVEEQRTNLATGPYSGFYAGNQTGVTFEPVPPFLSDPGVTPDAVRVSTTGADATRFQYAAQSQAVGKLFTLSWYERYVNYTPAVGTSALTLSSLVGLEIQTPLTLQEVKPGIFRATVTLATTLVGEVIFRAYFSKFTNVLNAVEFWAFQSEAGAFPTSYIPTNGSVVTRAADTASRALGGEFNQTEGTIFVEGSTFDKDRGSLSEPTIAYLGKRYSADALDFRFTAGEDVIILRAASAFSVTRPYSGKYKGAATYNPHEMTGVIEGGVVGRTAAAGRVLSSELIVGNSSEKRHLNGHVKRLEYYPRALSDTELQELTSL